MELGVLQVAVYLQVREIANRFSSGWKEKMFSTQRFSVAAAAAVQDVIHSAEIATASVVPHGLVTVAANRFGQQTDV